jgi:hypothetical protein
MKVLGIDARYSAKVVVELPSERPAEAPISGRL